jgi:hypothetical protein
MTTDFGVLQTLVFDLKGQPLREQDEMKICVKDWERVGRNRFAANVRL